MAITCIELVPFRDITRLGAFGCFLDNDGLTCWIFQDFLEGFAHCTLSDGSSIHTGYMPGHGTELDYGMEATPLWLQDDDTPSNYYTLSGGVLWKLHIGGTGTAFGDGYMKRDLPSASTGSLTSTWSAGCYGKSGSIRYVVLSKYIASGIYGNQIWAINVDTMTVIGSHISANVAPNIARSFMDANGVFWIVCTGTPDGVDLISWNPTDGAVAGALVVSTTNVSATTLGTSAHMVTACYNAANHSVLIGTQAQIEPSDVYTGDLVVVSLTTFLRIALRLDDGLFFFAGEFTSSGPGGSQNAGSMSAFMEGIQNGFLAIESDMDHTIQEGGVYTLINPLTFAVFETYNITALINAAHVATPSLVPDAVPTQIPGGMGPSPVPTHFANMRHSPANSGSLLVTYDNGTLGSPAYYLTGLGKVPDKTNPLGLSKIRNYCQVYGIGVSGIMDTQRPAETWITDLCKIANAAPVWTGSMLDFIPRCEVSNADNGATFLSRTSSGPVYDITDAQFIASGPGGPVTITRTRQTDAFNILPIEHLNRANNYHVEITTVRAEWDIFKRGAIKSSPLQLHFIHDQQTAIKVAWPLLRRSVMIERTVYKFKLPLSHALLDPYDLITITDAVLGLNKFPVRLTAIKENANLELECTAEPFYYGAHFPGSQSAPPVPLTNPVNTNVDPGSVNPPIIFEPLPAQSGNTSNSQEPINIIVSGSNAFYGGCSIYMSTDGGNTYNATPIATLIGNPVMGQVYNSLYPKVADPDSVDNLFVDVTESGGTLANFIAAQRDAFQSLCYLDGGGTEIIAGNLVMVPYELVSYLAAVLQTGHKYELTPTIRRAVYGTPTSAHDIGMKFGLVESAHMATTTISSALIGTALYFKFAAYNVFGTNQQTLDQCVAYKFTPSGIGLPNPPALDPVTLYDGFGVRGTLITRVIDEEQCITYEFRPSGIGGSTALVSPGGSLYDGFGLHRIPLYQEIEEISAAYKFIPPAEAVIVVPPAVGHLYDGYGLRTTPVQQLDPDEAEE